MSYTLRLEVAKDDVETLRQAGFSLCIARNVSGGYNVTWIRRAEFFEINTIVCKDAFKVYGLDDFSDGRGICKTDGVSIAPGQTVKLSAEGILEEATGHADEDGSFSVQNDYGLIRFGVMSPDPLLGNFTPMHLSHACVTGIVTITPVHRLMVWFERTAIVDGKQVLSAATKPYEVDFANLKTSFVCIRYASAKGKVGTGVWSITDCPTPPPFKNRL